MLDHKQLEEMSQVHVYKYKVKHKSFFKHYIY
jgi:hypothetical protein